ncbi:MAG TPA: 30S ribosomal protein S6 [Gemmatimonadaceae bacterium]|jgi:small subunit ribosomal protein S6|nr:30S ribosomal protein S6 [Gemmatimonadaceae bacterium]
MIRRYEAVYIFDPTLEEGAIQEKLARFHSLLQSPEEVEVEHWGRRQLAYKIGQKDTGYYVVARFKADTTMLPEYERALRLDDGVVRYLLTLYEHEVGAAAPLLLDEELAVSRRDDDEDED